ncbi:11359_t:CDS:2 [Cetraspora pellucida]|uniref:11359_t:CDS:1 n=1 Tax=Cetraspora pellucida TaxID=1433469 RepID=A0ACA9KCJ1_9GLOM|nr:11359_t:CDS:2 [Cetraspora pellucida]
MRTRKQTQGSSRGGKKKLKEKNRKLRDELEKERLKAENKQLEEELRQMKEEQQQPPKERERGVYKLPLSNKQKCLLDKLILTPN